MGSVAQDFFYKLKTAGIEEAASYAESSIPPYFGPSDEPLGWDQSGLVRLDAVQLAVHLTTARVALRNVTEEVRQKLVGLENVAVKYVARKAAEELLGDTLAKALGRLFVVLGEIWVIWKQIEAEQSAERAVRSGCLRGMRDLLKLRMTSKKKRVRRVRRIASRNPKT